MADYGEEMRRVMSVGQPDPEPPPQQQVAVTGKPYELLLDSAENAFKEIVNPQPGIPMNFWPKFNDFMGGLRAKEVTIFCAPTGCGKTQLNANISLQLLMQDEPSFVASVETGREDYVRRMASAALKDDVNDCVARDHAAVAKIANKLRPVFSKNNVVFSKFEERVEIQRMVDSLWEVYDRYKIKVAVLDNLNFFLKPVSMGMEIKEFDDAIHTFVMLVKQIPIHVWLVLHPRKTKDGRVESEFDIKGSSTAVQECSNVILFNRPTEHDIENLKLSPWHREMSFRKIRKRGKFVGSKIWFRYDNGLYEECGYEHQKQKIFIGRAGPDQPGMGTGSLPFL